MGFQPGHVKLGGRKKGSKHPDTICLEHGVNVFEEMLLLALCEVIPDKKFSKLRDLAPYLYAKPKDEVDLSKFTPEQIREYILGLNESRTAG